MNYTLHYTCQDCSWSAKGRAEGMPIKFFSSGMHPTQPDHDVWLEITQEEAHSGN